MTSRFLFVVPPLTGHVNPTVSVGLELMRRGHTVAWAAHRKRVEHLLPEQSTIFNLDQFVSDEMLLNKLQEARRVRGLASLKFLWREFFIPLASSMVPGVEAAIDAFQPDALLVDQQALAGAIVARQRTLPWATIATTSATLADPFRLLPTVQDWVHAELAQLYIAHGLPPSPEPDLSPDCVIVCSTREFVGESAPTESRFAWVGPAVMAREDHTPFPMEFLEAPDGEEERPVVLVSLGTLNAERGKRFYQVVLDTVRKLPIKAIVVAPDGFIEDTPPNVLVRSWVPQLRLLPHLSAVVTHGGHNTVCEALLHGVPLVVAPIKDDQPVVAGLVVQSGAGERVHFGRVRPARLQSALSAVLTEPSYRAHAQRVGASFEAAGGAMAAADRLVAWLQRA